MDKQAITCFLVTNPSLSDIMNFIEQEAQRIAKERKGAIETQRRHDSKTMGYHVTLPLPHI